MKLLSFVMPVYEPDLAIFERCVKSLCDQSLKNWELIVVLDGPCDAAKQIVNRLLKKKPNHFKIVEQEHSGVQRARNYGTSLAKGDFIVCWDSDCVIEVDTAKTWVDQFEKHPDIGFIYSDYSFLGEQGAIHAEPFDPFTLKIRNYISTCFPVRREFITNEDYTPMWNESLKSLQDWDFWLTVVEKGAKGKYLKGYAFSTAYPTNKSISGQGCGPDVWLKRIDAVKKLHSLPERDVCVSSLGSKHEGIWLAKLIDADYQDIPNAKPHKYKTIIQLGFSPIPGRIEHHLSILRDETAKPIVFLTCDDIAAFHTQINWAAIKKYRKDLAGAKVFVEDKAAYDMMTEQGIEVEILPLPVAHSEPLPLPERPVFALDAAPAYNYFFEIVQKSLPDVDIKPMDATVDLKGITGLCHFYPDRTVSVGMKRAILAGRGVVSNVQAPFMGHVNDLEEPDRFIFHLVKRIRELVYGGIKKDARDFYIKEMNPEKLKELVK